MSVPTHDQVDVIVINIGSEHEPFNVRVTRLEIGCAIDWDGPSTALYIPPDCELILALAISPERGTRA